MNKDLDDRLIPNGEYRDARNVSIGKSESADVGALETALGNFKVLSSNIDFVQATAIGSFFAINISNTSSTIGNVIVSGNKENNAAGGNAIIGMTAFEQINGQTLSKQSLVNQVRFPFPVANQTLIQVATPFTTTVGNSYRYFGGNTRVLDASGKYNGSIFLSGNYVTNTTGGFVNIETGMDITLISGSGDSGVGARTCTGAAYDAVSDTTNVSYSSTSTSEVGTPGNGFKFFWPLEVIGYISDKSTNSIYTFLTDNNTALGTYAATTGLGSHHYITKYVPDGQGGGTYEILLSGSFLNFSQQALITGVSIIENLLFWTDNRNQPRKINVSNSLGYYTEENQISVAKYSPYNPISLLNKVKKISTPVAALNKVTVANNTGIELGMNVIGPSIVATDYIYVISIDATTITFNAEVSVASGDELTFLGTTMTGADISTFFNGVQMPATTTWPGDPDYLESRFVRFSYRFQFDDGEYSIMAPFTQIAYIPKQKGYFINGDEDSAYRSTIVDFMENGVQNVDLVVPLPDTGVNLVAKANYKIRNIDILYKESDGLAVKVLDTLDISSDFSTTVTNSYVYNYQSRKPYRTLAQAQTVRVYDKVPTRALAQETAGNRIIYGNIQTQHTPPSNINYFVTSGDKNTTTQTNWAEYPNHSLKQNRNYQVGFILSDKYGRSSSVILSSVKTDGQANAGIQYGGSTVYTAYDSTSSDVRNWFGEALQVVVEDTITQVENVGSGAPGLYAETIGAGYNTFSTTSKPIISIATATSADNLAVTNNKSLILGSSPNPSISQGAIVSGEGIVGSPYVKTVLSGTSYVLSSAQTILANRTLTYTSNKYTFTLVASTTAVTAGTSNGTTIVIGANSIITVGMAVIGTGLAVAPKVVSIASNTLSIVISASVTNLASATTLTFYSANIPVIGSYLRGQYIDFTEVLGIEDFTPIISIITKQPVNPDIYLQTEPQTPDNKYAYTLGSNAGYNATGWYSYKVVVRQQEQDYYNVYLPGILKGYPDQTGVSTSPYPIPFPGDPIGSTSNIVLINDNINKVPRDLSEVGPDQKQFRSSVQLFGRVQNTVVGVDTDAAKNNIQYYPGTSTDTAISIATTEDSNMEFANLSAEGQANIYQIDSKPLIARLATSTGIGVVTNATANLNMQPFLAIYETEPQESLLDIFWETTESGLIADLNADVLNGFDGPTGFSSLGLDFDESKVTGNFITNYFYPVNAAGAELPQDPSNAGIPMTFTAVDQNDVNSTAKFDIFQNTVPGVDFGRYKIKLLSDFVYLNNSLITDKYTFTFAVKYESEPTATLQKVLAMSNVTPSFVDSVPFDNKIVATNVAAVVTRSAVNGSSNTSGTPPINTTGLFYSITLQKNASDNSVVTFFTINSLTGALTKSLSTPVGNYSVTIRVDDAYDPSASPVLGTGTKFTQNIQTVTVGPPPVNEGDGSGNSTCKNIGSPGNAATNQISCPKSSVQKQGVWYMAATALDLTFDSGTNTYPNFTSGSVTSDLPVTPSAPVSGGGFDSNYVFRLGTKSLESGTIVFSCNIQQNFTNNNGGFIANANGGTNWQVYYRANASSNWVSTPLDINNWSDAVSQPLLIENANVGTGNVWRQMVFAYDLVGEYCIVAENASTNSASVDADTVCAWVNSNDLYYNTCIVQNGDNVTTSSNPKAYQYWLPSTPSVAYNCAQTGNSVYYAPHPYANYVSTFYNAADLVTVWTPTAGYYSYKTAATGSPPTPFSTAPTETRVTARFNTAGLKIDAGTGIAGFTYPCSTTEKYALWCTVTCAHPFVSSY